jgi:hypothetical protein
MPQGDDTPNFWSLSRNEKRCAAEGRDDSEVLTPGHSLAQEQLSQHDTHCGVQRREDNDDAELALGEGERQGDVPGGGQKSRGHDNAAAERRRANRARSPAKTMDSRSSSPPTCRPAVTEAGLSPRFHAAPCSLASLGEGVARLGVVVEIL